MKLTAAWAKRLRDMGASVEGISVASKMGNTPTTTSDNYRHASKRQASRWDDLRVMQRAGSIRNLRREVPFDPNVKGVHVCNYIADHVYEERTREGLWLPIVEDVKGARTRLYLVKRALMLACYGVKIREV
jgi:hypothetical protein